MLEKGGLLASSVGKIIGTGQGRGIGFMFLLSGLLVGLVSIIISKSKTIGALENN
jgi:hypothetical protein